MNELYTINSIEKPFMTWCKEYGASPLQVRALMSTGSTLEEALQVKTRKHNVLTALNGVVKPFTVWCNQYGVTTHTLRRRVEQGMTLQEAFEHPKNKHYYKQKMMEQQNYTITKPFLSWCRDYLADPLHVRASMSMGYSLEYALKTAPDTHINLLPMKVEGQVDTLLTLCARYNKAANTIRRRVGGGIALEDAFLLPNFHRGEMNRLIEAGRANEKHTITQPLPVWCHDYHQPQQDVAQRLALGVEIEQALSPPEVEQVELGGEVISLTDLCVRLGLKPESVKQRIRQGRSVLEAVYETAGRKIKGRMLVDGEALRQARENSGLTLAQIAEQCNETYGLQLSKHILANVERGSRLVTGQERDALCGVLDISPEALCPEIQEL